MPIQHSPPLKTPLCCVGRQCDPAPPIRSTRRGRSPSSARTPIPRNKKRKSHDLVACRRFHEDPHKHHKYASAEDLLFAATSRHTHRTITRTNDRRRLARSCDTGAQIQTYTRALRSCTTRSEYVRAWVTFRWPVTAFTVRDRYGSALAAS